MDATVDNVKNGSYKIARPFIIATKDEISDLAADFIKFILSDDGQAIVSEKYITIGGNGAYTRLRSFGQGNACRFDLGLSAHG